MKWLLVGLLVVAVDNRTSDIQKQPRTVYDVIKPAPIEDRPVPPIPLKTEPKGIKVPYSESAYRTLMHKGSPRRGLSDAFAC